MVVVSLGDKIAGDVYCFIHGAHASAEGFIFAASHLKKVSL